MRHQRATVEVQELAALYALGSLTQHEARSFELHLREGCPVCETELRQFEKVVLGVDFGIPEVEPPAYLRDLLAARIERGGRPAPLLRTPDKEIKELSVEPQTKPPARPSPRPIFAPPPQKRKSFLPWALAAALAIIALLAFYAWKQSQDTNAQLQQKVSAALGDVETLRTLLDVQKERTGELEQILSILGNPGARVVLLTGQAPAPSASIAVLWDTQKSRLLVIGHLPPEPEGKVYQLWIVAPGANIPAGLLKTDPAGRTFVSIEAPRDLAKLDAAALTVEPEGGSQQPTMPFYAFGKNTAGDNKPSLIH